MKSQVAFSIDVDLIFLLQKEQSRSQLVNGLLRNYFKDQLEKSD